MLMLWCSLFCVFPDPRCCCALCSMIDITQRMTNENKYAADVAHKPNEQHSWGFFVCCCKNCAAQLFNKLKRTYRTFALMLYVQTRHVRQGIVSSHIAQPPQQRMKHISYEPFRGRTRTNTHPRKRLITQPARLSPNNIAPKCKLVAYTSRAPML